MGKFGRYEVRRQIAGRLKVLARDDDLTPDQVRSILLAATALEDAAPTKPCKACGAKAHVRGYCRPCYWRRWAHENADRRRQARADYYKRTGR